MGVMSYIGEQFHKPTGLGGSLATFIMNRQNWRQYAGAEAALNLNGTEAVLDVGFGNGYLLKWLAGRYACHFYGVDISRDMLQTATKRNRKFISTSKTRLSLGSAEKTGLESDSIDKIYTVNTVYFWSSLDAGLSEIRRILRPGGMFVNTVYSKKMLDSLPIANKGYAKYEIGELVEAGKRNGFEVEVRPIVEGRSYCVIYTKL
jgi:ubiquinone/menaquinone biosynthesis C-methylase UbiE